MSTTKKSTKKTVKTEVVKTELPKVNYNENVDKKIQDKINSMLLAPSALKMIKDGAIEPLNKVFNEFLEEDNVIINIEMNDNGELNIMRLFIAAKVKATRWTYNDDGRIVREVKDFTAYSDEDLANKPEEAKKAREALLQSIMSSGRKNKLTRWCRSDLDAVNNAYKHVLAHLDQCAHELKYNTGCRNCAADSIRKEIENIATIRGFEIETRGYSETLRELNKSVPKIFPDLSKYHFEDGKFVKNEDEDSIQIKPLKISNEQKEKLDALLDTISKENE